jgi:transcriptional regulator GlxA family with amidase domain
MHIAILTFPGFNEIDSFVALNILNRVRKPGRRVTLCCPDPQVTSMNGVTVRAQSLLEAANKADAVVIGSGVRTEELANSPAVLGRLDLDSDRQLIGAQCSGVMYAAKLGLLRGNPACTDSRTKPLLEKMGVEITHRPLVAHGNVATAGGCLAAAYLAAWIIARTDGVGHAVDALRYVAPAGETETFTANALKTIEACL